MDIILEVLEELFGSNSKNNTRNDSQEYIRFNPSSKHITPINRTYEITQKIRERDNEFSPEVMLEFAEKLFVEIHRALVRTDIGCIKSFVSGNLFSLLTELNSNDRIDAIEEFDESYDIQKIYISGYRIDDEYQYEMLTVCVEMVLPDCEFVYESRMRFKRMINPTKRIGLPIIREITCPRCGAAFENLSQTQCKYCNAVVNATAYEWLLISFDVTKW